MIYREDERSRLIYKINKDNLLYRNAPYLQMNNGTISKLYSTIYKVAIMFNYITNRGVYEKKYQRTIDCGEIDKEVSSIPRVAIYTCIIGGYDHLLEPVYKNDFMDFFVVTDRDIDKDSCWKKIDYKDYEDAYGDIDNQRINRFFKLHPHVLFPQYEYSIYIDGSVVIMADMIPLVLSLKDDMFIGVHDHPRREHLRNEKLGILKANRPVELDRLNAQLQDYYSDGYDDSLGLYENTIILRRHNDERCKLVMRDWWRQILKYSSRDQISLPYVLWKNGLSKKNVYIMGDDLKINPRFYYMGHKRKKSDNIL